MTDFSRLTEYVKDYFPEPKYARKDIVDWANESVPAWKYMNRKDKKEILDDWEDFIAPQIEDQIESKSPRLWGRIANWLRRRRAL
jgi:hypothetical protein